MSTTRSSLRWTAARTWWLALPLNAPGRLVVDVQAVDASVRAVEIARDAFCAEETAALAACPAQERPSHFCQLWTLKEALVKGMKMKIFRPLDPDDAALVFIKLIQGNFALVYLTGMRPETLRSNSTSVPSMESQGDSPMRSRPGSTRPMLTG